MSKNYNLETDEQTLLDKIPLDGSSIGNISLRRDILKWDETKYWDVRDSLYKKGIISLLRCRGGGIRRTLTFNQSEPSSSSEPNSSSDQDLTKKQKIESDFYSDLEQTLREKWAKDMGYENCIFQTTAQQGRRDTGGTWTRPDIVMVNVTNYRYVPGKQIDLISFEIKLCEEADVKAVYEALAHTRAATYAYLILIGDGECTEEELDEIKREAAKHGIGLLKIKEPKKYDDWNYILDPRPMVTNASNIEGFIETQLTDTNKSKINLLVK